MLAASRHPPTTDPHGPDRIANHRQRDIAEYAATTRRRGLLQTEKSEDPFDVGGVLITEEYAERLYKRAERGRQADGAPVLSENEASVVAGVRSCTPSTAAYAC